MKIGDLARETGVNPRLLRYYEEQELLVPERTASGHRRYGPDAVVTVRNIRTLLAAGVPTRLIRDILPCVHGEVPDIDACVSDHLRVLLGTLDTQIADLQRTRSALANLMTAAHLPAA
ncbi:MerR family transcriptional regulator [Bailinhaonella thermotolerans]|uniref:MerR family transcriptional regulator n=1 Tax=Bailinhaonella thermotolerans TaxID=1070861 RepID=A0A3A4B9X5_9ACTN|nr:MerR family transcriptional regulator [Bailinhaonella thermotolerans]RJL30998.1 MerR family transcriptional regulator [Bailinhaonella thermotolerans]